MKNILFLLFVFICGDAQASQKLEAILKRADNIRNPAESYFSKVSVTQGSDKKIYEVSLKGADKTFIKTVYPPKEKDRNILMVGESMWVTLPNVKRPVRVGLNQKLTGDAANGDIARLRWSGDYEPKLEKEDKKTWQLFLKAKKKGLTYDQLRVWIEKKTYRPLRAEFLTVSGKVLKRATYGAYKTMEGMKRPTITKIVSAVEKKSKPTYIKILKMNKQNFPDSLFDQTRLQ